MNHRGFLEALCNDTGTIFAADCPLNTKTTFRVGGRADYFLEPTTKEGLSPLLKGIRETEIPCFILGKGSNVLFSDDGYRGVVVHIGDKLSEMSVKDNIITCQSGQSLNRLCSFALGNGLSGLEFAYGIPGSVGGAVYMNAGAYGGEIKDVITASDHIDTRGKVGEYKNSELCMSYRKSVYTGRELVITSAKFQLTPGDKAEIRLKMEDFMSRRRSKQPLDFPSAGSTFKRPKGGFASALIDECGLKGFSIGGAQVSEKHAGFVINKGNATSSDIIALMEHVRATVMKKTGFDLEPEVLIVR